MSHRNAPDGHGVVSHQVNPHEDTHPESPTRFGQALRRQVFLALGVSLMCNLLVLVTVLNLWRGAQTRGSTDGALVGCICWVVVSLLWGWMTYEHEKPDRGLPERGLIPYLLLIGPVLAGAAALSMLLWPLLLGENANSGTVGGELWDQPLGIVLLAGAVWVMVNVGLTMTTPVIAQFVPLLIRVLPVLPAVCSVFLGLWWFISLQNSPFRDSMLLVVLGLIPITALGPLVVGLVLLWFRRRARLRLIR